MIADCYAVNNQINDEWLVRDFGAIVQQLGWTSADYARQQISDEGGAEVCIVIVQSATDVAGPYQGKGNDDEWGQTYADILTGIMHGDNTVFDTLYDRAAIGEYSGDHTRRYRQAGYEFFLWAGFGTVFRLHSSPFIIR